MAIQDVNAQSNRNHAVPQNIMDVEFKIIGDLSMRQFSYILIFGLMGYMNSQLMVGLFKWPLTIFFSLLGIALAFVPVQDRGLDVWLVNFIKSVYRPTQMVWKKSVVLPTAFLYDNINVLKQELITLAPTSSRRKLEEYLDYSKRTLPSDPLDIPEAEYIKKVRDSFRGVRVEPVEVEVKPVEVRPTPVSEIIPPKAVISVAPTPKEAPVAGVKPIKVEEKKVEEVLPVPTIKVEEPVPVIKPIETRAPVVPRISVEAIPTPVIPVSEEITYAPITPDRHSGRRFTSFLPSKGELVLPIRGERVLMTSDQTEIEEDLASKTEKLQQLLSQIRQSNIKPTKRPEAVKPSLPQELPVKEQPLPTISEKPEVQITPTPVAKREETPTITITPVKEELPILRRSDKTITQMETLVVDQKQPIQPLEQAKMEGVSNISKEKQLENAKVLLADLTKKRNEIVNQISNYKNTNPSKFADKIRALEIELIQINSEYQKVKDQVISIEGSPEGNIPSYAKDISQMQATDVPTLNKPNVLWGFVKDINGKPLSDMVVIVKNLRGEPVRATKTNELGQFILSTPLNNGKYSAEISSSTKKDVSFDIVSLEASGNVIPPIEFQGK